MLVPEETAAKIDGAVMAVVRAAREKADRILRENARKLNELSEYLLERETITGAEFMVILNRA